MTAVDNFRRNLAALRRERGLDAANLSLRAGLNRRAVTDIESGASKNPTLATCAGLAAALGVPLAQMIGEAPRAALAQELDAFLGQYSEDEQRTILRAIQALRPSPSE